MRARAGSAGMMMPCPVILFAIDACGRVKCDVE